MYGYNKRVPQDWDICPGLNSATKITKTAKICKGSTKIMKTANICKYRRGLQRE